MYLFLVDSKILFSLLFLEKMIFKKCLKSCNRDRSCWWYFHTTGKTH